MANLSTMKKYSISTFILFILLATGAFAQTKNSFLDTIRLGMRYQSEEFHTLNQKLLNNCNCDEALKLGARSLQGISVSLYEPLNSRWAVGGDLGGVFGRVMDDNRNYKNYSFVQMRAESFYNLFDAKAKLRPYLSGSLQLVANPRKAFFSLPFGAGLRYSLARGGYLHVQTAYDRGFSPKLAKNLITNVGFHVPIYKRKKYNPEAIYSTYVIDPTGTPPEVVAKVEVIPSPPIVLSIPIVPPRVQEIKELEQLVRIVYFDTDKYSLNKLETNKVLVEVEAFVKKYPNAQIYLTGHTDSVLDEAYNLALSKKRVQAVLVWLIQNGVASKRISSSFFGEVTPATSNDGPGGKAGNRRVEIIVK
jgi:outer membrane protein OmpA-like peptidoglycan-associated protein